MCLTFVVAAGALYYVFELGTPTPTYTYRHNFVSMLILSTVYLVSALSASYCLEPAFLEPSYGQMLVLCGLSLLGILTFVLSMIMQLMWQVPVSNHPPLPRIPLSFFLK